MFLYEPVERGLFWVMKKGMIACCKLFLETSTCEGLCVNRRQCILARILNVSLLDNKMSWSCILDTLLLVGLNFGFHVVESAETGQEVFVFEVGISHLVSVKGLVSSLLYISFTCACLLTLTNLV